MFRRIAIAAVLAAAALIPTSAAGAATGQECPGNTPGIAQPGVLDITGPFNPSVGGYYANLAEGVTYCIPAGWQVLSMNALPGNPTYAVRVGDVPWVSFTYDAWGESTPQPRPSWVFLR